jgi:hypothetical protein
VGYTFRQGLRVGVSAYRGPYAHRGYKFYKPGEPNPRDLPGSAYGIDVQWGRGPWTVWGELQRFQRIYRVIPTFNQHTGFAEVRRVLHPRWYAAARIGYLRASSFVGPNAYDVAVGFRPNRHQLVKVSYMMRQASNIRGTLGNIFAIQLVTAFRPISIAQD